MSWLQVSIIAIVAFGMTYCAAREIDLSSLDHRVGAAWPAVAAHGLPLALVLPAVLACGLC